jgi:hemerythrin
VIPADPDLQHVVFDKLLETGDPEIDRQHRELFHRLDQLLGAAKHRRSHEEVGRTLAFLGDYVVHHFAAEERMMALSDYPEAEGHHEEHQRFVHDLGQLHQELKADGPTTLFVIRVGNRVTTWLREHIYRTDRRLVDHLKARRPL